MQNAFVPCHARLLGAKPITQARSSGMVKSARGECYAVQPRSGSTPCNYVSAMRKRPPTSYSASGWRPVALSFRRSEPGYESGGASVGLGEYCKRLLIVDDLHVRDRLSPDTQDSYRVGGHPARVPKRPKLRSSCDACGAAKLKCDRGQPRCGRCVNYDIPCMYGVSRKNGRPRRDRLRPNLTQTPKDQTNTPAATKVDKVESNSGSDGEAVLNPMSLSGVPDLPVPWDAGDENSDGLIMSHDAFDQPGMPLMDFNTLDFREWGVAGHSNEQLLPINPPFDPIPTPESPDLGCCTPASAPLTNSAPFHQTQDQKSTHHNDISMPFNGIRDHDCPQEAYKILGNLSFTDNNKPQFNAPSPGAATADATGGVPLDHVLRLNRVASEQLSHLLTCSCAKTPNLALLYASNISRILNWYQQAAICTQSVTWTSSAAASGATSRDASPTMSLQSSSSGSLDRSSTCSSTTASNLFSASSSSDGTLASTPSSGITIGPAKMAVGTFSIDDTRVQTALKIQLVLGEMRRAGLLIDQFIASHHYGGHYFPDEVFFGGVECLYQGLDSWLRCEHSRIVDMMRSRLRELNT
ncbi:hypothetical protein FH972_026700 [Carpinus fangiana]|uniref:Zn(2)-C6 fungal-type domain-containing protein n=1 Tax=Carpinus fangiana TaxID=176857 RepID=A0A5N6L4S0_9ROSI|nr:hypothetical protein FH972_026700 [Carpinus fangiana]